MCSSHGVYVGTYGVDSELLGKRDIWEAIILMMIMTI